MPTHTPFSFFTPTRIEFGCDTAQRLPDELARVGARRPLLLSDKGVAAAGLLAPLEDLLQSAGYEWDVFTDVASNPTDANVAAATRAALSQGNDAVVAVGGGSSMDTAKAVAMLAVNGGEIHRYFGCDKMAHRGLPLIAIPTTAGTGSEVTIWAVITDTRGEVPVKESLGSGLICPTVALVDPRMTVRLPPHLTAYTGLDALSHAVEAYIALPANPMSDVMALAAVERIGKALLPAVANGENIVAREQMLLGSLTAGLAFSNSDTAAIHSLGEAIGGRFNLHHGLLMGLLMPYVLAYNRIACPDRFAGLAAALGVAPAGSDPLTAGCAVVERIAALNRLLRMPSLEDLGVTPKAFEALAETAMRNLGTPDNPRRMTTEGFVEILTWAHEQRWE